MMTPMGRLCPKFLVHEKSGTACFRDMKRGFSVRELHRIGLWPIPYISTQKSIQEISNCLLKFNDYSINDPDKSGGLSCDLDFKHHLLQATEKASKRSRGLCLNCVKNGKIMIAEGNCRATSLELCKDFK